MAATPVDFFSARNQASVPMPPLGVLGGLSPLYRDLRLADAFDPARAYAEQRGVVLLDRSGPLLRTRPCIRWFLLQVVRVLLAYKAMAGIFYFLTLVPSSVPLAPTPPHPSASPLRCSFGRACCALFASLLSLTEQVHVRRPSLPPSLAQKEVVCWFASPPDDRLPASPRLLLHGRPSPGRPRAGTFPFACRVASSSARCLHHRRRRNLPAPDVRLHADGRGAKGRLSRRLSRSSHELMRMTLCHTLLAAVEVVGREQQNTRKKPIAR